MNARSGRDRIPGRGPPRSARSVHAHRAPGKSHPGAPGNRGVDQGAGLGYAPQPRDAASPVAGRAANNTSRTPLSHGRGPPSRMLVVRLGRHRGRMAAKRPPATPAANIPTLGDAAAANRARHRLIRPESKLARIVADQQPAPAAHHVTADEQLATAMQPPLMAAFPTRPHRSTHVHCPPPIRAGGALAADGSLLSQKPAPSTASSAWGCSPSGHRRLGGGRRGRSGRWWCRRGRRGRHRRAGRRSAARW